MPTLKFLVHIMQGERNPSLTNIKGLMKVYFRISSNTPKEFM